MARSFMASLALVLAVVGMACIAVLESQVRLPLNLVPSPSFPLSP